MTKLTEAADRHYQSRPVHSDFKSGWLAALEEVANGLEATKDRDCDWDGFHQSCPNIGRESLRREMAKVLEGLK